MAEEEQEPEQPFTNTKLVRSYVGLSFSIFLALLPSSRNHLRRLSLKLAAEEELPSPSLLPSPPPPHPSSPPSPPTPASPTVKSAPPSYADGARAALVLPAVLHLRHGELHLRQRRGGVPELLPPGAQAVRRPSEHDHRARPRRPLPEHRNLDSQLPDSRRAGPEAGGGEIQHVFGRPWQHYTRVVVMKSFIDSFPKRQQKKTKPDRFSGPDSYRFDSGSELNRFQSSF